MSGLARVCMKIMAMAAFAAGVAGCLPTMSGEDPDPRSQSGGASLVEMHSVATGFADASILAASQAVSGAAWKSGTISEGKLSGLVSSGSVGNSLSTAYCDSGGKKYLVSWLDQSDASGNFSMKGSNTSSGAILAGLSKVLPQDQIGLATGGGIKLQNGDTLSLSGCGALGMPGNAPVVVTAVQSPPSANVTDSASATPYEKTVTEACPEGQQGTVIKTQKLNADGVYETTSSIESCSATPSPVNLGYLTGCDGSQGSDDQDGSQAVNAESCKQDVFGQDENKVNADTATKTLVSTSMETRDIPCAGGAGTSAGTIGLFTGTITASNWSGSGTLERTVSYYTDKSSANNGKGNAYGTTKNGSGYDRLYDKWVGKTLKCQRDEALSISCGSITPPVTVWGGGMTPINLIQAFAYDRKSYVDGFSDIYNFIPNKPQSSTWSKTQGSCQWTETAPVVPACPGGFSAVNGSKTRTVTANGSVSVGNYTYGSWNVSSYGSCLKYETQTITPSCSSGWSVSSYGTQQRLVVYDAGTGSYNYGAWYTTSSGSCKQDNITYYLSWKVLTNFNGRQGDYQPKNVQQVWPASQTPYCGHYTGGCDLSGVSPFNKNWCGNYTNGQHALWKWAGGNVDEIQCIITTSPQ